MIESAQPVLSFNKPPKTISGNNPCISVIMAVYNGEDYLRESIDSILNQTFPDFEFIIIDDASNDGTPNILRHYAGKDRRLRLVQNQRNIGQTRSLNKGLSLARGKFIARQDADDISLPHRLETEVKFLLNNPAVVLVGSAAETMDTSGCLLRPAREKCVDDIMLKWNLLFDSQFVHTSVLVRTDVVQAIGGYSPSMQVAQDYDLWSRISHKYTIANIPDVLVRYREHDQQMTKKRVKLTEKERCLISTNNLRSLGVVLSQNDFFSLHKVIRRSPEICSSDIVSAAGSLPLIFTRFKKRYTNNNDYDLNTLEQIVKEQVARGIRRASQLISANLSCTRWCVRALRPWQWWRPQCWFLLPRVLRVTTDRLVRLSDILWKRV